MRHFVGLSLAVAALTRSVGMTTTTAALVPLPGIGHATGTHLCGALSAAVAVTAITVHAGLPTDVCATVLMLCGQAPAETAQRAPR